MHKKVHIIISLSVVALQIALLSGCNDERIFDSRSSSSSIKFNVSLSGNAQSMTRSEGGNLVYQESVKLENDNPDKTLYLNPSVSDYREDNTEIDTRGNIISSAYEMFDSFYVSAYQYDDTWDENHIKENPNYFEMQTTQKSGNVYVMSPQRYWPSSGKMRFLAHAPVNDDSFTYYGHDDADRGARVHVKISDKVAQQNDLLVSYTNEISCSGSNDKASLNFKHALTGIRFVCDKKMPKYIITNITIKGVRYEGDFFFNMTDAKQSSSSDITIDSNFNNWEIYDRVFSLDLSHLITGEDSDQITDGENTFVMLPQTLPDNAVVQITMEHTDANGNSTGEVETISGSLSGREWPAGKIVTYKISTSDQVLEVEEPATFNYLGSVYNSSNDSVYRYNDITVASFAGNKNMKWKVEYQDDGASTWSETSSWLSVDSNWTWADTTEQKVRFIATSSYNAIDIDQNLKNAASKGSNTTPYNLSNHTGGSTVENTANSYIIDSPGYYMLPLVYGNAVKNSQTNESAYIYTAESGDDILTNLVNHLGNPITSPFISDNSGCVPDHASIVWQDANKLVQNVEYVPSAFGGKGGIKFYVDPSYIGQGNAVISISDKDNVMWSWHIWVTNFSGFDSTIDIVNQENQTFTLMPVNLGWCSNGEKVRYYPKRECKVRFTPVEGDLTLSKEITFVQESHMSFPFGNNPYYQWGRKDPFVGTNIAWGNKERWDGNGTYYGTGSENNPTRLFSDLVEDTTAVRLTAKQCLHLLIQNPDKWHNAPAEKGGSSYVSTNDVFTNLWGANTITSSKTVYDPCPVGYEVNYYYTYTGFLDPGYDANSHSDKGVEFVKEIASDWDGSKLAEFYTDSSKLHSIMFPVSGYRDWNDQAEVVDFGVHGFEWLQGCVNNMNAYMFRFAPHTSGSADVAPVTSYYTTDGFPVRPGVSK